MLNRAERLLDNRSKSHFNISIATGIALSALIEATNDVYEPIGAAIDVEKYNTENVDLIYINIDTLIRNIITSVEDKNYILTHSSNDEVLNILKEEALTLDSLFETIELKVIFFVPDYEKVFKILTRKDRRPIPSQKDLIEDMTIALRTMFLKLDLDINILSKTFLLPKTSKEILILSHYTHDLLNVVRVPKLKLLESHTGKVIDRVFFNKKYAKTGQLTFDRLPFSETMMAVVGDKSGLFKPSNIKIRHALYDLIEKRNWNPSTSKLRMLEDSKTIPDLHNLLKEHKLIYT